MKHIQKIFVVIIVAMLASSVLITACKKKFDEPPHDNTDPNLPTNIGIKSLKSMYTGTTPMQITQDLTFKGIVVSSDEAGNFYKELHVQDDTAGIKILVNAYDLYNKFPVGRRIYIKCKGLYLAKDAGMMTLAGTVDPGNLDLGGIDQNLMDNYIVKGSLNNPVIPFTTSFDSINNSLLNSFFQSRLVRVRNVQFENTSGTFAVPQSSGTDNTVGDCIGSAIVRTSGYANFATTALPTGNGDLTAVFTLYNSTEQLIIRDLNDVPFTNTRCSAAPKGGSAITYTVPFTENFESFSTTAPGYEDFPRYINDPEIGTKYWRAKSFSSNKYIEMSSFGGAGNPGTPSKVYFFFPVDFTVANSIQFKTKSGYDNGATLKVYIATSANYTPLGAINVQNFSDITSNFSIPSGPSNGYATSFSSSNVYNFDAALTGNGFVVFEYTGSSTVTTTMQLDDITVQ